MVFLYNQGAIENYLIESRVFIKAVYGREG